jgi:hypothetical protein
MEKFNQVEHSDLFINILQDIGDLLVLLNSEYVQSHEQPSQFQSSYFAFGIIKTLLQKFGLLKYLSQNTKQDLIDTINIHNSKYIDQLIVDPPNKGMVEECQSNISALVNNLKSTNVAQNDSLTPSQLEVIKDLLKNIVQNCRALFAEQAHNDGAIDRLQISAIVFNLFNVQYKDQIQLFDKLLLVKELWETDKGKYSELNNNFKVFFHSNIAQILANFHSLNKEEIFDKIITMFVDDHSILESLNNEQLTKLYDRLKNIESNNLVIDNLLHKLHHEAQFRYSHNRAQDSGYELLKRFQNYDAMLQRIEDASFFIAESFLVRNNIFIPEMITLISKHIDNIKVLGYAKNSDITDTLNKLKYEASIYNRNHEHNEALLMFSAIESKLDTNLDSHVLKRYSDFSNFIISSLRAKYVALFQRIKNLIHKEIGYTEFLEQTIARKFAKDYYISSLSNSVDKLKLMIKERYEIYEQLSEIDFVEIFSPEHLNKISSLNFRRQLAKIEIKSQSDYIHAITRILVANLTASQLEAVYRPLIKSNLTKMQTIIKQELSRQIKQRTSITKIILSIFKGGAQEINKLKTIENYINIASDDNNEEHDAHKKLEYYNNDQKRDSRK